MNCKKCGGYIRKRDTFCPHCGAELTRANYKPQQKNRNSEYKPLQGRFKRGEYQDREEDFYDQYIENQNVDDHYYQKEKPTYQKPRKKYRGYDLSEYYPDEEETEGSSIGMAPIILILIIALLMGFIIGVMMFTSGSLPSVG